MPRFNIALLPVDTRLQTVFAELAQKFQSVAAGYLLGTSALAHVTLCQFCARDQFLAKNAFDSWPGKTNINLRTGTFRYREGEEDHAGMLWAEVLMEKSKLLLDLQKDCFAHLAKLDFELFTTVRTYAPHITLARIPASLAQSLRTIVAAQDQQAEFTFRSAVGISTENGVFVREILK